MSVDGWRRAGELLLGQCVLLSASWPSFPPLPRFDSGSDRCRELRNDKVLKVSLKVSLKVCQVGVADVICIASFSIQNENKIAKDSKLGGSRSGGGGGGRRRR
jgi:hypothetical protein